MSERPQVHDNVVPALARGVKLMPDQIAIEILKRCDGKATMAEIIEDLAVTFSADRDQVAGDVRRFLQDLADKGMLTV